MRATHGVSRGAWYCEAAIGADTPPGHSEDAPNLPAGHVRLGWARSKAELQAPVTLQLLLPYRLKFVRLDSIASGLPSAARREMLCINAS